MAQLQGVEARDGAQRPSEHGDDGRTTSSAALFTSTDVTIFSTITFVSANTTNTRSMVVFMSMKSTTDMSSADEDMTARQNAMSAPIGGACKDGDGRSKYGIPRSVAKH
jgi:hypothetical protein